MHIVEVRRRAAELAAMMAQMRSWVDHHRAEPGAFEMAFLPERQLRCRLSFHRPSEALAFARAFDGELLDDSAENRAA